MARGTLMHDVALEIAPRTPTTLPRPEHLTNEFNDILLRIYLLALVGALLPSAPLLLVRFPRP